MNSRERILEAVKKNQPTGMPVPALTPDDHAVSDLVQTFTRALGNIGGTAIQVAGWDEITALLAERFSTRRRWVNMVPELGNLDLAADGEQDPKLFENVQLSVMKGDFGVAENGAVWITDSHMGDRALPFICEHLALVIRSEDIFPTLHEAYEHIGVSEYNFGTFIAGPSKTADIEQSLVLGAHGPKSMTLFLLQKQ